MDRNKMNDNGQDESTKTKKVNNDTQKVQKNTSKDENIEVLELWEPHADEIKDAKDRHVKMSKKSTHKIVISLVIVGLLLTMWYAVFAQPLAFNTKQTNDDGSWNIGFTDMQISDIVGGAKELGKPSFTSTKANFYISLTGPGDKIVYDLTIKNSGTFNAKVDSIYIVPENKPDDYIIYSVGGISLGDELDAGESTHMTVTAMYNRNVKGTEFTDGVRKDMSVIVNYKQA